MTATRDTSQRRLQISELVRQHGSVQVTSLAKRFGVSMQTVRKDLRYLTERGVMARAYGGAIDSKVVGGAHGRSRRTKPSAPSHLDEKRRIGQRAAALVKAGDTIVIDSGTTGIQLAEALPNVEVTVVTNDFGVLYRADTQEQHQHRDAGRRAAPQEHGVLRRAHRRSAGRAARGHAVPGRGRLRPGARHHHALTSPRPCSTARWSKRARMVIAITDSSKFGKVCLHRIMPVGDLDTLITDTDAPEEIVARRSSSSAWTCSRPSYRSRQARRSPWSSQREGALANCR